METAHEIKNLICIDLFETQAQIWLNIETEFHNRDVFGIAY